MAPSTICTPCCGSSIGDSGGGGEGGGGGMGEGDLRGGGTGGGASGGGEHRASATLVAESGHVPVPPKYWPPLCSQERQYASKVW